MLKNIEELAKNYKDVEEVKKALRSIQSRKSKLKNQKSREDYDEKMTELLQLEQTLKEVRDYFEPREKYVTEYTLEDVKNLTYDETIKAIRSIQSKKCLSQHLTPNIDDNEEYKKACQIEMWLLEHKENIKPIDDYVVRKSQINDLISHLQTLDDKISKEYIIKQLENLII